MKDSFRVIKSMPPEKEEEEEEDEVPWTNFFLLPSTHSHTHMSRRENIVKHVEGLVSPPRRPDSINLFKRVT